MFFFKNKIVSTFTAELLVLSIGAGLFFTYFFISLLFAFIPSSVAIAVLSSIIIICTITILFDICKKNIVTPLWCYCASFYILLYLCVVHNPVYLPWYMKAIVFGVLMLFSFQVIKGYFIHLRTKTLFVFQFELIDRIKIYLMTFYIIYIFNIVGNAFSNQKWHLLFLPLFIPIFIGWHKIQNFGSKNKWLIPSVFSIIGLCVYDFISEGNYFLHIFELTILILMFVVRNMCNVKQLSLLLLVVLTIFGFSIYSNLFLLLPEFLNTIVSIIGLTANIFTIIVCFIKFKQATLKKFFSNIIGKYQKKEVVSSIDKEIKDIINNDDLLTSSIMRAIEYCEKSQLAVINKETIDKIKDLNSEEEITINDDFNLSKSSDSFILKIFKYIKFHWPIELSIIIWISYFAFFMRPFNLLIISYFEDHGNVPVVFSTVSFAKDYSEELIHSLQYSDPFEYANFQEYAADKFSEKADVFESEGDFELQLQSLNASLFYNRNYEVLYDRLLLNNKLYNYQETVDDYENLISFYQNDPQNDYS
ncbi:MAG: hypothetical protein LBM93_01290, partial [Oscillospiraceae bacterium]|nr:hypothetical protein [Oscillospiraceae bacterium]